ncbi:dihydrolipoamide acetyltransferase family protein [Protofrankia symbiont of Coriaria ruscifolia]|uniref:dihydrolipoamide acetyltransferase family protein n=1 Tax=Protofrankia symbiont of Coriaria ruscifolia TaxID=1306542 RepID=UPI00324215F5
MLLSRLGFLGRQLEVTVPREQFRLPDLGEGLPDAEIVRWLVEVGERVTVNQPIVEVETAKALVDMPSPFAGVLTTRHAEPGDTVEVGQPLMTIDTGADTATGDTPTTDGTRGPESHRQRDHVPFTPGSDEQTDEPSDERMPVLVGYGPRGPSRVSRRTSRRGSRTDSTGGTGATAAAHTAGPAPAAGQARATSAPTTAGRPASPDSAQRPGRPARAVAVLAKPPVRKLARDLGVDLGTIAGTGPHGTISRADVEAARVPTNGQDAGRVRRIPVTGVRRAIAQAMVASAANAPQVTEFVSVDVTETVAARERLAALSEFADVKVTPLLFVAKALLTAVSRQPMINSRWEDAVGDAPTQIVVHEYVNLGIAVASPRGLVVPNIANADEMSLVELAHALHELTMTARSGKSTPETLRGGTITITNIGVFGADIGTPILNPPEAAILALGAIRPMPWVHQGELAVRTVAQLALTFDHRIVDGELGSKVLADVARMLADPAVTLAWN